MQSILAKVTEMPQVCAAFIVAHRKVLWVTTETDTQRISQNTDCMSSREILV